MKIKIGIVEDQFLIAGQIYDSLQSLGYQPLPPVGNYTNAIKMIEAQKPDMLLLDIQLSGKKDGIDLALKVKEEYGIPFIFLTANSDPITIERAKAVNPPAYLVKPFKTEDLYTSIEICLSNFSATKKIATGHLAERNGNYLVKDSVFIRQNEHFHKIMIASILYLESDKNYLYVHTDDDAKLWVRGTLQGFVEMTSAINFVRVHKCFVVNTDKITLIETEKLFLGAVEIPISKPHRKELLQRLQAI